MSGKMLRTRQMLLIPSVPLGLGTSILVRKTRDITVDRLANVAQLHAISHAILALQDALPHVLSKF